MEKSRGMGKPITATHYRSETWGLCLFTTTYIHFPKNVALHKAIAIVISFGYWICTCMVMDTHKYTQDDPAYETPVLLQYVQYDPQC